MGTHEKIASYLGEIYRFHKMHDECMCGLCINVVVVRAHCTMQFSVNAAGLFLGVTYIFAFVVFCPN